MKFDINHLIAKTLFSLNGVIIILARVGMFIVSACQVLSKQSGNLGNVNMAYAVANQS